MIDLISENLTDSDLESTRRKVMQIKYKMSNSSLFVTRSHAVPSAVRSHEGEKFTPMSWILYMFLYSMRKVRN